MNTGKISFQAQQGSALLEGLVSILIFSLGILGLIGMQANAIKLNSDAKYRTEATFLVDQLLGELTVASPALLADYAHNPTGTDCNPTQSASANTTITNWLGRVNTALPSADSTKQKVIITNIGTAAIPVPEVTITICWQPPNGTTNKHSVSTTLQWQ